MCSEEIDEGVVHVRVGKRDICQINGAIVTRLTVTRSSCEIQQNWNIAFEIGGEMPNPYLSSPNPLYSREDKTGAKRGKEDTNKTGPNQTWEHPQTWKVCGIPTVQRTRIPTTTS